MTVKTATNCAYEVRRIRHLPGLRPAGINVTFVEFDGVTYLIGPGPASCRPTIRRWVAGLPEGRRVNILLTHYHPEQGNAALQHELIACRREGRAFGPENGRVVNMSPSNLWESESHWMHELHSEMAEAVYGRRSLLNSATRWARNGLLYGAQKPPSVFTLPEGREIAGLRVVALPGHTPNEIGFYHPDDRILFSGDLIQFRGPGRHGYLSLAYTSNDLWAALESLDRVLQMNLNVLVPACGDWLRDGETIRVTLDDARAWYEELIDDARNFEPAAVHPFIAYVRRTYLDRPFGNGFEARCNAAAVLRAAHGL